MLHVTCGIHMSVHANTESCHVCGLTGYRTTGDSDNWTSHELISKFKDADVHFGSSRM